MFIYYLFGYLDRGVEQEGLVILKSQYFYPLLDGERAMEEKLKYAYTNHLWFESWRSFVFLRRFLRRVGLMSLYHKLRGLK